MPLVYVTGCAGSGKSTIAAELRRLGLEGYDEDDLGSAHNIQTGRPVAIPDVGQRSEQWFVEHEWRYLDGALDRLRGQARTELVILCGNCVHPAEAVRTFDLVIYLDVDDETVSDRLASRAGNDYGKAAHELRRILESRERLDAEARSEDVRIVDGALPLGDVIDQLLEAMRPVT